MDKKKNSQKGLERLAERLSLSIINHPILKRPIFEDETEFVKDSLTRLIDLGLTTRDIAAEVNLSQTAIRHWLNKFGLKTNACKKKEFKCDCGETDETKFHNKGGKRLSRSRCKACHNKKTVERFRQNKVKAVEYKGGKCCKCGYNKCSGSLHFHHRDSTQKDPNWRQMRKWKFEKIKKELDKCDLVCANCHGELHW